VQGDISLSHEECPDEGVVGMLRSERAFNLAVSVVTAMVLTGASAWAITGGASGSHGPAAASTSTTAPCRAGYGYGDDNHCHVGPPGQATSTTSSSTSTSTTSSTSTTTTSSSSTTSTSVPCKPGYGYGDDNHCHSGPPGQATHAPSPPAHNAHTTPAASKGHKGGSSD
jgi:hypothetical protein